MSNANSNAYLMFLVTQIILKKKQIRLNFKALQNVHAPASGSIQNTYALMPCSSCSK